MVLPFAVAVKPEMLLESAVISLRMPRVWVAAVTSTVYLPPSVTPSKEAVVPVTSWSWS